MSFTPTPVVRKIVGPRWRHRLSLLAIALRLAMAAFTVHAVWVRCRLNRLSHIEGNLRSTLRGDGRRERRGSVGRKIAHHA